MRKPYPIKIVDEDDERVSIRPDMTIELAGKTITSERAIYLANWLLNAAKWCEGKKAFKE